MNDDYRRSTWIATRRLRTRPLALAALMAAALLVAACDGTVAEPVTGEPAAAVTVDDITVRDAWLRPAAEGGSTAAYFVAANRGGADDRLLRVAIDGAAVVEIHETVLDGDIARMEARPDGIVVPAGGETAFAPMGLHVMVVDVRPAIEDGATVDLVLEFERAGSVVVPAEVTLGR